MGKQGIQVKSANALGIEWIGDYCQDGSPHFIVNIFNYSKGTVFKCINCLRHVWLPIWIQDAAILDSLIDKYGAQAGYLIFLDKNREAKVMMAKLQDLEKARHSATDDREFMKLVVSVMEAKDYDRLR